MNANEVINYGAHGWGLTVERRQEPTRDGLRIAPGWGLHVPLRKRPKSSRWVLRDNARLIVAIGKQKRA